MRPALVDGELGGDRSHNAQSPSPLTDRTNRGTAAAPDLVFDDHLDAVVAHRRVDVDAFGVSVAEPVGDEFRCGQLDVVHGVEVDRVATEESCEALTERPDVLGATDLKSSRFVHQSCHRP